MARIDDGELYLEIEGASEEQLRAGLIAARKRIARTGFGLAAAFAAQARVDETSQSILAWEQGLVTEPDEPSDEDQAMCDAVDAAWWDAVLAAEFNPREQLVVGRFGLLNQEQQAGRAPALRDLFEPVN